jgi:hypothetical protein
MIRLSQNGSHEQMKQSKKAMAVWIKNNNLKEFIALV